MGKLGQLFGAGRGRVLAFCWLGWVFDFYDLILFAFLKTAVGAELGLELETEIAWIDGVTLAATAIGGFGFGRYADRCGRQRALVWSIVVYSTGAFATAFAVGPWSLLAARVVTGLGVGGEWGVAHALVAETYPERLRGRAAALLQSGAPVGMALAAAVGCFAGPQIGWRTCFLLSALPALLVFFARRMLAAAPTATRSPSRHDDSRSGRSMESGSLAALLRAPYRRTTLVAFTLLALHMTGFWCTYAWLPATLIRDLGVAPAAVGWFQIQVNAVHVFADIGFGFVADRFGRRRTFAACCLLFAAGLLAVAFAFSSLVGDWPRFALMVTALGIGAGSWSYFGVMFAEHYPVTLRATAASGLYNLSRGVQLFTQPALGQLALLTGTFAVGLHVGAATALLSALMVWWLPLTSAASPERS